MKMTSAKKDGRFLLWVELIGDLILVNLAFYTAFMIRYRFQPDPFNIDPFYEIIPFISIAALVLLYTNHINARDAKTYINLVYSVTFGSFSMTIIAVAIAFFARGFAFPRTVFILSFFIQFLFLYIWKASWKKYLDTHRIQQRTLVIGSLKKAAAISLKMMQGESKEHVVTHIARQLDHQVKQIMENIDVVMLCDHLSSEDKSEIISYCMGKQKAVYILPELYEISLIGAAVQQFDDTPACLIDNLYLSIESRVVKRFLDILVASLGLLLLSPVMLAIAMKIKRHDGQSPFYVQERVTRDNKPFKLYKFRTMVHNAEKRSGPVLTTEEDPRLLPFGQSLRSKRLDELPQLLNVLKGEMSIVGPRPERKFFVDQFQEVIPEFKYRLAVKAGITGLAQVSGKYTTSPEDKLRYDLLYIRNYSLLLDLKIIVLTLRTILTKEQAAGKKQELSAEQMIEAIGCEVVD